MESSALKEKFILLRAKGMSFDKIAKELGKAKQTLVNWARELEDEIAGAKAIELEALAEQFYLTKQAKIKTLGEILSGLKEEIHSRSLAEVPTEKLLDLFTKYYALLETEYVEPRFKSEDERAESREDQDHLDLLVTGRRKPKKPRSA